MAVKLFLAKDIKKYRKENGFEFYFLKNPFEKDTYAPATAFKNTILNPVAAIADIYENDRGPIADWVVKIKGQIDAPKIIARWTTGYSCTTTIIQTPDSANIYNIEEVCKILGVKIKKDSNWDKVDITLFHKFIIISYFHETFE